MCGIWAILGYHGNTMDLMNYFQTISGRGPDNYRIESINHYKDCCLGFHRLSIVGDLDGMQPIRIKQEPHLSLIANGEIYNYKMLLEEYDLDTTTHCDIECMIHLYEKLGVVEMAKQLDGDFACFIFDTLKKKVFLIRDRHGIRPIKFILSNKGFLGICSEAKGLVDIIPNIPHDTSIQVEILMPGTIIEFDIDFSGRVDINYKTHRYATINGELTYKRLVVPDSNLDVYENIRRLLKAAVSKRLQSERRIGCLLSGGLDSSLISGLLVKCMKEEKIDYKLQTFSIGMGNDGLDVIAARKVSQFLDTEHYEVSFTFEDAVKVLPKVIYRLETFDITTIRASVGMYLVAKFIHDNTDSIVIFSGEGADELAEGYIYFHKAPNAESGHQESLRLLNDLHYFDIRRADRTMSGWGLEARVPFLDHQFDSYYLSIDPELRKPREGVEKWLIRKAFTEQNIIPHDILWRPKEAFSDGVSQKSEKPFYELLTDYFELQISDEEFAKAKELYSYLTPLTKEAYFYRKTFEEYYPNQIKLTPYFWMPKFMDATDPSAKSLSHYKFSLIENN